MDSVLTSVMRKLIALMNHARNWGFVGRRLWRPRSEPC
jgi:hypothetical protein